MDLWTKSDKKIMEKTELKARKKAKNILRTSGLYVYVKMKDNTYITVYDRKL